MEPLYPSPSIPPQNEALIPWITNQIVFQKCFFEFMLVILYIYIYIYEPSKKPFVFAHMENSKN